MSCQWNWLSSTNKIKKSIKSVYEFDKIRHNICVFGNELFLYDFVWMGLCSYINEFIQFALQKIIQNKLQKLFKYKCNNNILQNNKNKSLTLLHVKLFFYTCLWRRDNSVFKVRYNIIVFERQEVLLWQIIKYLTKMNIYQI